MGIFGCCADNYIPNGIIIDVRSKSEYDSEHIKDCINIPHYEIGRKINEYVTDKNTPINLYCAAGGRASAAKSTLISMGYTQVANLGGYSNAVEKINAYNNYKNE